MLEALLQAREPLDGPVAGAGVGALVDPPPRLLQVVARPVQAAGRQQPGQAGRGRGRRRLLGQPGQLPDQGDGLVPLAGPLADGPQQAGLAGPVGADQADDVAGRDGEARLGDEQAVPDLDGQVDDAEHDGRSSVGAWPLPWSAPTRQTRNRLGVDGAWLCSGVFATRPELRGSFGMVSLDPLAGLGDGDGGAGAGRQRLRRRRGRRLRAAGGGAAPERPGGEVPILAAPAGQGRVLVVNGQGPVPAAATIEAVPRPRPRPDPGHRAAARLRAGRVRGLDAAAARPRHALPARRAGSGHRLRRGRVPGRPADRRRDRRHGAGVPRRVAVLGRGVAGRRHPRPWRPAAQPGPGRDLAAPAGRGRASTSERDGQIEAALAAFTRASWPRRSPATWPRPVWT